MKPMIVSEIKDQNGRLVANFTPEMVRQVVSAETARQDHLGFKRRGQQTGHRTKGGGAGIPGGWKDGNCTKG